MYTIIFTFALQTLGILCFLILAMIISKNGPFGGLSYELAPIFFYLGIITMGISTIMGIILGIIGRIRHPELKRYKILFRTSYILLTISALTFIFLQYQTIWQIHI